MHLPSPVELLSLSWASLFVGDPRGLMSLEWATALPAVSFLGGYNPHTGGLWLSDVIHHHLAIGVLSILAGHLYRTQFHLGTGFTDLLRAHGTTGVTSWHSQLAINLAVVGSASIVTGHLLAAVPAYGYLRTDWSSVLNLFVHHVWIGGFFIVGAAAHAAIYVIRDYQMWSYSALER